MDAAASRYRWWVLAIGVLAQAALAAYHQGLPAIAPELQHRFAIDIVRTGILLSAVALGVAATLAVWGLLADRFGERAVLAIGLAGAAIALVLAGTTSAYLPAVAALVAAGMAGSVANAASGRAVMSWFGVRERGFALGIRQMATPLGGGIAALVLPLAVAVWNVTAAFLVLAGVCAAAALACGAGLSRPPGVVALPRPGSVSPVRDARLWRLATGGALIVAAQLSLVGYLVLFLNERRGLALPLAAAVLTGCQLAGAGARVAAGAWSDRLGVRIQPMRQLGFLGAALLAATALLADAPLAIVVPLLFVTTVVNMSTNGLAFTATGEMAGQARAGVAMGFQNTFLFVSGTAAPIAFGAIVTWAGWGVAFAAVGVAALAGALLLTPLLRAERMGWARA